MEIVIAAFLFATQIVAVMAATAGVVCFLNMSRQRWVVTSIALTAYALHLGLSTLS